MELNCRQLKTEGKPWMKTGTSNLGNRYSFGTTVEVVQHDSDAGRKELSAAFYLQRNCPRMCGWVFKYQLTQPRIKWGVLVEGLPGLDWSVGCWWGIVLIVNYVGGHSPLWAALFPSPWALQEWWKPAEQKGQADNMDPFVSLCSWMEEIWVSWILWNDGV